MQPLEHDLSRETKLRLHAMDLLSWWGRPFQMIAVWEICSVGGGMGGAGHEMGAVWASLLAQGTGS